ncbi:hypothetical protein GCM10011507_34870 [Edaphobacter acidisoli]|uniref:Uncharacterized protein n=1 Tax=Edaphobacter acidisoli TaxID=2040573 RepID=A0A916S201_9BACT|nr:hypothetical protein [Edaphobacter acidisoli]GGA80684.1 hypothetical protein GCM10011507_34870 [Edaphobacter acidisoli]
MHREEFLEIDPRYFAALVKEHQVKLRRADEMTEIMGAQIVAMVRRCGFIQFEEQLTAKDFMPSLWKNEASAKPKRLSRRQREKEIEDLRIYWKLAAGFKPKR